ncbi:2264_t:CDS:2 [Ambispora leptoticha]|uniref:DNA replication licensing factor MCM7 n=1 Tax=Ambispora leptoticha TaxID=144679 RepID=A0A9N9EZV9_9GLOM|nr:2264_t:CDS:2 [Ambispora leptoticha]
MALTTKHIDVNYDAELETIKNFLEKFKSAKPRVEVEEDSMDIDLYDIEGPPEEFSFKYMEQLQKIANREQDSLIIELDDVSSFINRGNNDLVGRIIRNAKHYIDLFLRASDALIPIPTKEINYTDDVLDVLITKRKEREQQKSAQGVSFPPSLTRRHTIYFKPLSTLNNSPLAVREVTGGYLGHLVTIRGIITRVSDVKPFLLINTYACDVCGDEVFQEITKKSFMPLFDCPSARCKLNKVPGKLVMETRASKFLPFQEVKLQEETNQVPVGHIPRTMTIHLYGSMTRTLNPGDRVDVAGIYLPTPYTGIKAIRAGLLTDTYLEAQYVGQLKKQYDKMEKTPEIEKKIQELSSDPNIYTRLSQSIAPEIFGHEDVKKALLLLLVGGVTKTTGDGMKIRGDLNICLMGDPGVAKSQLLKFISKVAPRGVYTTGRGSSGVGLTAAVMRDPVTDEMVLEGGALVLADNGICCIDEFDKMEDTDRTAIHEVMEQQTISISKAGITTTLNARTSILAAANPLYGRYNPKISPVQNINLPAALLSRFDVLFLILDSPSLTGDTELAQHVVHVHTHENHPSLDFEPLEGQMIRHYVAEARSKRPVVSKEMSDYIVDSYVRLRQNQVEDTERKREFTYTSARTLLAVLRMSQALARIRLSNVVIQSDVDEALRLIDVSKASLNVEREVVDGDTSVNTRIYELIREMYNRLPEDEDGEDSLKQLKIVDIRDRAYAKGFTSDQLQECFDEYSNLNIWMIDNNRRYLTIANP